MTNVSICDRCGKIIESGTEIYSVVITDGKDVTRTFKKDNKNKFDLCQECRDKLKDFMNSNQRIK